MQDEANVLRASTLSCILIMYVYGYKESKVMRICVIRNSRHNEK